MIRLDNGMHKISFLLLLMGFVFFGTIDSKAQQSLIAQDSVYDKSEFIVGMSYSSDYLYMGRADSLKAPYLSPSIAFYHKSGFYAEASMSYLVAANERRVDLVTLSGGYDYYGDNFVVGAYISEYFFNDDSYVVNAQMNTYLNAYGGYDFSWFMLYGNISMGFSDGVDVFLGGEINRTFYLFGNHLQLTPAFYVNGGSQQYYDQYINKRVSQGGSGIGNPGGSQSGSQLLESDQFKLLDFEADVTINYTYKKLDVFLIPTFTFPVNPATISTDTGVYEEELSNGFYWTIGISYTF